MTPPADPPTVGPWAQEKLELLRKYLAAFTTALRRQSWAKTMYVDAFAGTGQARLRVQDAPLLEATEGLDALISGSPKVALGLQPPFARYVFIERDSDRVQALEQLAEAYRGRPGIEAIDIRQGDANDELATLADRDLRRNGCRAVIFLDPYGMQVAWDTIAKLAATRTCEIIVTFPLGMAVRRLLPRDSEPPAEWHGSLTRLFGTERWLSEAYSRSANMFGPASCRRPDAEHRLLRLYQHGLQRAFGHVSPARPVLNTKKVLLYHLIWAGPHPLGLTIASQVFRTGLRRGGARQRPPG